MRYDNRFIFENPMNTSNTTKTQFGKYLIIGLVNFFVDFSILNLLIFSFGLGNGFFSYALFRSLSVLIATLNSFYWNKSWVFRKPNTTRGVPVELLLFFLVAVVGIGINVVLSTSFFFLFETIFPFLEKTIHANMGAVCGIAIAAFWNFFGYKYVVFKE